MRIASKIGVGSGLLLLLLVAVLAYHLSLVRRTVSGGLDLSDNQFRAWGLLVEQAPQIDRVRRNALKLIALGDLAYAVQLEEQRAELDADLERLLALELGPEEQREVKLLAARWDGLWQLLERSGPAVGASGVDEASVRARLGELEEQARRALETTRRAVAEENRRALERRREAERISIGVVLLAALLIALVVYLTARSIREPLHELTRGTRAVAEGALDVRLGAARNDEFSELARAFNHMVARLSQLDRLKRDFVAHVSHELKNPLVAMHETNQLLLEELPGPLTAKQRRLLELNVESGRRLAGMLSNLLDLSSLEAGAMTYRFRELDAGELLRLVAGVFEARARERRVALELEEPAEGLVAIGDRERLIQVLENLVDNALKHTPPGGRVTLAARHVGAPPPELGGLVEMRFSPPALLLTVTDTGPGIADDAKPTIFRKFHQVEGGSRAGGVGLGLAICREIVEAHGGALGVADAAGGGSCFWLLLAARPAASSFEAVVARAGAGSAPAEGRA